MNSNVDKCPVCHESLDFFCYSQCSHPTCMKCAIKLRKFDSTLDGGLEYSRCPSCRGRVNKVVMMAEFVPFNLLTTQHMRRPLSDHDTQYEFFFENADVEMAYAKQLLCICPICGQQMPTLSALNRHTSNEHNLFYCDLCINHARLLPSEFIPMTQEGLAKHRHYDKDKKKGHPSCDFCDKRFYEFEDLIKHIKERHFMCELCANSGQFETFKEQSHLFNHYDSAHFVCHRCKKNDVISIFATNDDLGLHQATKHGDTRWNPITFQHAPRNDQRRNRGEPEDSLEQMSQFEVNKIRMRDADPSEWTREDFPTLEINDQVANNVSTDFVDEETVRELRAGARQVAAVAASKKTVNKRSLAEVLSSSNNRESFQPQMDDFPALHSAPSSQTASTSSWGYGGVQAAQQRQVCFVPRSSKPTPADFPSLEQPPSDKTESSDSNAKGNKKKGKHTSPIDFSQFSLVNNMKKQPLSQSAQRILQAQNTKTSVDVNIEQSTAQKLPQPAPAKVQSSGGGSSLREVKLSQRMKSRGQRAYIDETLDEEEERKQFSKLVVDDSFKPSIPVLEDFSKPEKSDFPTLGGPGSSSSANNGIRTNGKNAKPKPNQQNSSFKEKTTKQSTPVSSGSQVDPEATTFAMHSYTTCGDFAERNTRLTQQMKQLMEDHGSTKSAFTTFADISKRFLKGDLNAVTFLSLLNGLLVQDDEARKRAQVYLSEMIHLLPSVARQRSLLRCLKAGGGQQPNDEAIGWMLDTAGLLSVCKSCKQVVLRAELPRHNSDAQHQH